MRFKYPSTPYHYLTPGRDPNDKVLDTNAHFLGKNVVITEKMDGESFTGYSNGSSHARSIDSQHHFTRDWVKKFWAERFYNLPYGWRVNGENTWAQHSIKYDDLESYFFGFAIWDQHNNCLSWDDTLHWFKELDILPVPVLYRGEYSDQVVKDTMASLDLNKHEGIVIRLESGYTYADFGKSLCKLVRPNHVQTDEHWKHMQIEPNKLRNTNENNDT